MRGLALAALAAVFTAQAQTFPSKPPKIYVGFVPGGGVDQTTRITTAKLAEVWGTSITVEHKPGAHFLYNSSGTHMLSAIVTKVTGQTVLDFLRPRLFEPLRKPGGVRVHGRRRVARSGSGVRGAFRGSA